MPQLNQTQVLDQHTDMTTEGECSKAVSLPTVLYALGPTLELLEGSTEEWTPSKI